MKKALVSNFEEYYQKAILSSNHTFGKNSWEIQLGEQIDRHIHIPSNILKILSAKCPFSRNKKIIETHPLIFIPSRIGGETIDSLKAFTQLIDGKYKEHMKITDKRGWLKKSEEKKSEGKGPKPKSQAYWVLASPLIEVIDDDKITSLTISTSYRPPTDLELAIFSWVEHFIYPGHSDVFKSQSDLSMHYATSSSSSSSSSLEKVVYFRKF